MIAITLWKLASAADKHDWSFIENMQFFGFCLLQNVAGLPQ